MASHTDIIYIGVTNNLIRRVEEHKNGIVDGFSKKYKTNKIIYYEYFRNINDAISREKELKGWRREKKVALIEKSNPHWEDTHNQLKCIDPSSP